MGVNAAIAQDASDVIAIAASFGRAKVATTGAAKGITRQVQAGLGQFRSYQRMRKYLDVNKWKIADRVKEQLKREDFIKHFGEISEKKLLKLAHNPKAHIFVDTLEYKNHINIIQKIKGSKEGRLLRITVTSDEFKIFSVGIVRESSLSSYIASERYVRIPNGRSG